MAGPLGKLIMVLGLDAREFNRGITQTESVLGRFGAGSHAVFGVATAAASLGFGIMAKGALEMEERTAAFQAATGASAQEAAHFADVVNAASGRSLVAMDDIAESATAIRTDLGLMGAEADATLDSFLRYERATGQGAEAVLAFDDILDAWNLTAADTQGVMDVLIKSHQEYGGSIAENQELLASLAPALQAANMSWEEGQGILNLFARAGVSGEAATTAFSRALTKVESPEELQALLEDISDTEDPFERATKAAELFGTRAGTKLGQALSDAEGDLGRFVVSVEDAADATGKAASALDSTLTSQIKLAVNQATSILRGFGSEVGPILMGAFSAVSLGQALGAGRLFRPLANSLSGAWTKAGGSALVTRAIGKVGLLAGLAYQGAAFVATKFIGAAVALWAALGGPQVTAAAGAAGAKAGAAYAGAAASGGFLGAAATALATGAALLIPPALGSMAIDAVIDQPANVKVKGLTDATSKKLATATGTDMVAGIQKSAQDAMGSVVDLFGLRNDENERAREWQDMAMAMVTRGTEGAIPTAKAAADALYDPLSSIRVGPPAIADPIEDEMDDALAAIRSGFGSIKEALKKGSRPQLISREDRIANMEKRQGRINKQLHRAVVADDPFNIAYWTKAAAKQQVQLDVMRGKSRTTTGDIRRKFESMGVDIDGVWADTRRNAQAESGQMAATAKADADGIKTHLESLDFTSVGANWMLELAAGIRSNIAAVGSAAAEAANAARSASAGARAATQPTPVGAGAGTTYVVGTLIANDSGIDELDRRISRRRRLRDRGPMRYQQID